MKVLAIGTPAQRDRVAAMQWSICSTVRASFEIGREHVDQNRVIGERLPERVRGHYLAERFALP